MDIGVRRNPRLTSFFFFFFSQAFDLLKKVRHLFALDCLPGLDADQQAESQLSDTDKRGEIDSIMTYSRTLVLKA